MACVSILISDTSLQLSIVIAGIMVAQAAGLAVAGDGPQPKTPACMRCGTTSNLREICVCECSTKKTPKTEYTVTCDPICVPRWSGFSWPFARCLHAGGCTACQPAPCRAWVRSRKKLIPETKDEEVAVIERKVESICDSCAGGGELGCCSSDPPGAVGKQAAAEDGAGMIRGRSAQESPSDPKPLRLER